MADPSNRAAAHGLSGVPAFAARHPDAVVLSVGIGLDTRADRLAGRTPSTVRWLGVDLPEVVRLRRELLPGGPTRVFAAGITDPGWADGPAAAAQGPCWCWPRAS
ncbi:hypothetical protein [Streptomyces sp. NPDC008265]|uniref:hypothetical protein n=1 Tax=Streptomyces sp. NPDC008265 TaxID=3364824 RepID=UPI0036E155AF